MEKDKPEPEEEIKPEIEDEEIAIVPDRSLVTSIKIPVFKPEFVKGKNFAMLVFASRNSGKSHFVKYMIINYFKELFDSFIFISDSPDEIEEYSEIIHGVTLRAWDETILQKIQARNEHLKAKGKRTANVCIIFDDKISNKIKNEDSLLQIFARGRHVGISIIFLSQSIKFADTAWRSNADIIVSLKANSSTARERLIENILMGTLDIPNYKDEKIVYRNIIKKYMTKVGDALVVDNRYGSALYRYKAGELHKPRFRVSKKREYNNLVISEMLEKDKEKEEEEKEAEEAGASEESS